MKRESTAPRIIRLPEVLRRTGVSRTTIWDLMRKGDFPASIQLTKTRVGWVEAEVDEWIADRITRRGGAKIGRDDDADARAAAA